MHLATCPPEADLLRLFRENLPETEAVAVEEHVLHCGRCLEKLKDLAGAEDSLADLLRRHTPTPDFASSPVVAELMKQLKSLRASSAIGTEERPLPAVSEPAGQAPTDADRRRSRAGASLLEATRDDYSKHAGLTDFLSPSQAGDELGRLGKYRILQVLGHGGMGVVYKAEDPVLKRAVAVKAMLPSVAAGASAGQRFLREAQTLAAVEHDHIVRIHDVAEERGVPFLAMEFLKGEPLDVRLERDGKLSAAETVRIGREIAAGLQSAHERGLIHRDIKPANVWLEAPRGRVKILDFGLARPAEQDSALTQQGAIVGTPAYMSPEQARGDPVDARSDLFSLGVVLYRLCAGRLPFQGRDTISTLMAVASNEPPPPVQVNPELPPELSDMVMALLQKDPERRPAAAAAVVEALQGLEEKLPREPGPQAPLSPGVAGKRGLTPKRRRLPLLVGSLVLLLGLAGLGLWTAGVFRFSTDKGDLVFESDDPDFAFAAAKDGGVTLEDRKTQRTYRVKATPRERDEYELEVLDKDAGLSFKTKTFTVKRGEKVALKSWFERKKDEGPLAAPPGRSPPLEEAWLKAVAAMPAQEQVQAVARKLQELNPGFDGVVKSTIEGSVVTGVEFSTKDVTNLAPVRALTSLKRLVCAQHEQNQWRQHPGKLADLSPLRGMSLTELNCEGNRVADLSPLKGMPLIWLSFGGGEVEDLSPLIGMPLTHLNCASTRVADLSALKDMRLGTLHMWDTSVGDLSPLKDMPLTELHCGHTRVGDLSPLKGMRLTRLCCAETSVVDLMPLENMPLASLDCCYTRVRDLSPLRNMPLKIVWCAATPLADLSPLKGLSLTYLSCDRTRVVDLSPLRGMPLQTVSCDFQPERDSAVLRSIKTLEQINNKPAAEFWKEVDAKAANKKP